MKNILEATFENLKHSFSTNNNPRNSFPTNHKGMTKKQLSSIKGGDDIVISDIIGG